MGVLIALLVVLVFDRLLVSATFNGLMAVGKCRPPPISTRTELRDEAANATLRQRSARGRRVVVASRRLVVIGAVALRLVGGLADARGSWRLSRELVDADRTTIASENRSDNVDAL